jgi:hypothetical protein
VRAQVDRFARPRDLALEDAIRIFACGDADERTGSNFAALHLSNIGEDPDFVVLRHPVKQGAPVRHKIADVDMSLGDNPVVGGGDLLEPRDESQAIDIRLILTDARTGRVQLSDGDRILRLLILTLLLGYHALRGTLPSIVGRFGKVDIRFPDPHLCFADRKIVPSRLKLGVELRRI